MRPYYEKVTVPAGFSWELFDRREPEFPFNWHYHPEFELTLTLNSIGERFIGDHVASYGDGDLILVGPNLPHAWQSRAAADAAYPHRALVIWFTAEWVQGLIAHNPELAPLGAMLAESARGLAFSDPACKAARSRLLALVDAAPAMRWLGLLEVLLLLANDAGRQTLALQGFVTAASVRDRERLDRVLTYLHAYYGRPVRLAALAGIAAMSESQLQRFFKCCTRMSVSDYLLQLRIGRACSLLLESDRPVALIAAEAGYRHPSYFTRQFRAAKGTTPLEFRRQFG